MPTRPSFATIPSTEAESAPSHDRSLRRARAIETLSSARIRLDYTALALLLVCSASLAYITLSRAADQFVLALFGVFAAGLAFSLWFAVRDLRARVDALQELVRDIEAELDKR